MNAGKTIWQWLSWLTHGCNFLCFVICRINNSVSVQQFVINVLKVDTSIKFFARVNSSSVFGFPLAHIIHQWCSLLYRSAKSNGKSTLLTKHNFTRNSCRVRNTLVFVGVIYITGCWVNNNNLMIFL